MDASFQDRLVLQLVLEYLRTRGEWPTLKVLHQRVYRELHMDFDVRDSAKRLAPSPISRFHGLQEPLVLSLVAFRELPEAQSLLAGFVDFVRYSVDRYRGANGDVEVSQDEVRGILSLGERDLALLPLLVQQEPFISNGWRPSEDGWLIEISDEIVRLRDIADIHGYLDFKSQVDAQNIDRMGFLTQSKTAMARASRRPKTAREGEEVAPSQLVGVRSNANGTPHREKFRLRDHKGIGSFVAAVMASLVAAMLWWLFGPDSSPPPLREPDEASTSAPPSHPLARYMLSLADVQQADDKRTGWQDATDEQLITFSRDEICGAVPRPLPTRESAVAYQRGSGHFVVEAVGIFEGASARAYFDELERLVHSCRRWKSDEFGVTVVKALRSQPTLPLGAESLRFVITTGGTTGGAAGTYRIDNVYVRRGNKVANVAQLASIAPPDPSLTEAIAGLAAEALR